MNRQIKSIINKHAFREGSKHGFMLRTELLAKAKPLVRSGMPLQAIIKALGVPMPQPDENNAPEDVK